MLAVKGVLTGLRLFRLDSWLELVHSIGFFALACVLFLVWRCDAMASVWAFCGVTFVIAVSLGAYLFLSVRRSESDAVAAEAANDDAGSRSMPAGLSSWRVLMVYSLATWGAGSLQAVWRYLDRYMLLHLARTSPDEVLEQLGGYFIASKLAQPLTVVAGLLGAILLPHAVRYWEEHKRDEVGRMIRLGAKLISLTLTMSGAVLIVLKRPVLQTVVGRIPESADVVLAPVVVTVVLLAVFYIVRTYLLCRERVWVIAAVWCVALAANAAVNAWLIPRYGLYGAAMATLASAGLAMVATNWVSVRDGLELDAGTWLTCGLPVALLLPVPAMLATATVMAGLLLWTSCILTAEEKQLINAWAARRMPRLFSPALLPEGGRHTGCDVAPARGG
jgi:O-antigen/teichoic acid export membrane protein